MASERARKLRKDLTDAERFVWAKLRDRRFADYKFRRQVPLGAYIIDFVCFEMKLIVELDGGQHVQQQEYDAQRTEWLYTQAFRVLRFWNHEVLTEWEAIASDLAGIAGKLICPRLSDSPPLTPGPSPTRGEGGIMPLKRAEKHAGRSQKIPYSILVHPARKNTSQPSASGNAFRSLPCALSCCSSAFLPPS